VTAVIDIPSQDSPSESEQDLMQKRSLVNQHLADLGIPLHYYIYSKSNPEYVEEMGREMELIVGSFILFTSDHDLLNERAWEKIFQMASWEDLPLVINSKNERAWEETRLKKTNENLLEKAIYYAEKYTTRLYVLNIATKQELDLIEQA